MIEQLLVKIKGINDWFIGFFGDASNKVDGYFENTTTIRVLLLWLAEIFVVGIVLYVICVYIKSLVKYIQLNEALEKDEKSHQKQEDANLCDDELEKELEKDFEKEVATKKVLEWAPVERLNTFESIKVEDVNFELDWVKGQHIDNHENVEVLPNIAYKNDAIKLVDMLGLAIELISRGVDEFKVAQTLMYKTSNKYSEDEILQMIDAINSFASLCAINAFESFDESGDDAIVKLIASDVSLALSLIEQLMDVKIDLISQMKDGDIKDKLLFEVSNLANLFGTFASLFDNELALGAFELSLEVMPNNINSWSKIGNIYKKIGDKQKAVWAYENVLSMGTDAKNQASFANSRSMLSSYYQKEQGYEDRAVELNNKSKSFYDMIGINRHLADQEIEVLQQLEQSKATNSRQTALKFIVHNKNSA